MSNETLLNDTLPKDNLRLQQTLAAIDGKNRLDPNHTEYQSQQVAKEWLYGQRMSQRLALFCPDASELLQIACRAQHIQRWVIPRRDYPMDKAGYKRWRTELGRFHARTTAEIMAGQGYSQAQQERVQELLQKKQLKRDPEVQTLEDVACLVFLEHYLPDFAAAHEEQKIVDIIRKTWNKMSDAGHVAALQLPLPEAMSALVGKALQS